MAAQVGVVQPMVSGQTAATTNPAVLTLPSYRISPGDVLAVSYYARPPTGEFSFAAHIEKDVWNFQLFGEKGGATLDPLVIFRDENGAMLNCTPAFVPNVDVFAAKMRDFVDTCLHGKPSLSPGAHGLMVQRMLNGIYDSAAAGGREVDIA